MKDAVSVLKERIKAKPKTPKYVVVTYSVPLELDKMIQDAAERAGCSQAEVARAAFEQFFQVNQEVVYQR